MLAGVPRVLMGADVPPGPAVKAAFAHRGDVVGYQVVAQAVALIDSAPQLPAVGIDGQTRGVADAGSVDAPVRSVRIKGKDVGALVFRGRGVRIIDVRVRPDRDEQR